MIPQNFTHRSQQAIAAAQEIATSNGQPQVEPPHLFLALRLSFNMDFNRIIVASTSLSGMGFC